MTQQEEIRESRCSSSLLATSVRKSDSPIILLFSENSRAKTEAHKDPAHQSWMGESVHILSSMEGSTLGLTVKRFSSKLASKSTYKNITTLININSVQLAITKSIRSQWKYKVLWVTMETGCNLRGKTHNFIYESGDVVKILREFLTDLPKQLNRLRKVPHWVPDAHCAVYRLTSRQKHINVF